MRTEPARRRHKAGRMRCPSTRPEDRRRAGGQLNADFGAAEVSEEFDHPGHGRLVLVGIQADAAGRDTPPGLDPGRFDEDQCGPAQRELAQVNQMPVGHGAVMGRILAHGGDDDAVGEFQAAKADG